MGTGWGDEREGSLINGRHPYRKLSFAIVVLACWIIGLFGLDRSRMSSFQLPIVVLAGLLGYLVVVVIRHKLEDARAGLESKDDVAHNCVVIKRFGEARAPQYPSVKILESRVAEVPPTSGPEPLVIDVVAPTRAPSRRRPAKKATAAMNYIPLTGI
ncbi:MAG TPA: hypothetical protein VFA34_08000 [Actinomycetota bacterium]|nr:hypothetical protein [Actinomycetota bacterium]